MTEESKQLLKEMTDNYIKSMEGFKRDGVEVRNVRVSPDDPTQVLYDITIPDTY